MLARDKVFFNNGTIGAMPRVVFERTVEHLRKMAVDVADWDYRGENWIAGYGDAPDIRGKAARLLNADAREIALTENVTCANSYIASGLDLESGCEIVTSDQEHPGGQSPWLNAAKRHSGTVKKFEMPKPVHSPEQVIDIVTKAFTPRTRVLFFSHVITGTGGIMPIKEICAEARRRNILTRHRRGSGFRPYSGGCQGSGLRRLCRLLSQVDSCAGRPGFSLRAPRSRE